VDDNKVLDVTKYTVPSVLFIFIEREKRRRGGIERMIKLGANNHGTGDWFLKMVPLAWVEIQHSVKRWKDVYGRGL
jgi:hypothetical protein